MFSLGAWTKLTLICAEPASAYGVWHYGGLRTPLQLMRHSECFAETLLNATLLSLLCRKPQRIWGLEWHHHLDNHTVEKKVSVPECTAEIKN